MPFTYDPRLRGTGYRNIETGRLVTYAEVRTEIDTAISAGGDVMGVLADMVSTNSISPDDWHAAMRTEIKDQYIAQYLVGRGGTDQMTQSDWGSIGGSIADQYRYLDGFYGEVAAGDLTEGQIRARARMYANSSREAYERGLLAASQSRGYSEHRWVMNAAAENCPDCEDLSGEGWKSIDEEFISPSSGRPAIPGSGETVCLTNCQCYLDYRGRSDV